MCEIARRITSRSRITVWSNIDGVAVKNPRFSRVFRAFFTATRSILLQSVIRDREVILRRKPSISYIDHIRIRSELMELVFGD